MLPVTALVTSFASPPAVASAPAPRLQDGSPLDDEAGGLAGRVGDLFCHPPPALLPYYGR
jgi:hypothetical protein